MVSPLLVRALWKCERMHKSGAPLPRVNLISGSAKVGPFVGPKHLRHVGARARTVRYQVAAAPNRGNLGRTSPHAT
jgi:hypothetical protein